MNNALTVKWQQNQSKIENKEVLLLQIEDPSVPEDFGINKDAEGKQKK